MLSSTLNAPITAQRYDGVARALHWAMAVGLFCMMITALVRFFADDTPLADAVWPWHRPVGFSLFLLLWVRMGWAWKQRNAHAPLSSAAKWGHRFLYLLMLAVPSIALLRQYGSGRAFEIFGCDRDASHRHQNRMDDRAGRVIARRTRLAVICHDYRAHRHGDLAQARSQYQCFTQNVGEVDGSG